MQQIASVLSTREAARYIDVDATTIQRAIARGDLNASRPREHAPYRIQRSDLFTWAAANGYAGLNGEGERVDLSTGEVLAADAAPVGAYESAQLGPVEVVAGEVTPIAAATAARARLAGVAPVVRDGQFAAADYSREPRFDSERAGEANVARILLPSADAGLLEAAKRLVALPESPELWQALRAVLGVTA